MKWNETAYISVGNSPVKTIFAIVAVRIKWIWTMRFARKVHKMKSNERFNEMISLILPWLRLGFNVISEANQCNWSASWARALTRDTMNWCAHFFLNFDLWAKPSSDSHINQNSNTGKKQDIVSDDVNNKFIQIIWRMKPFSLDLKFRMQVQPLMIVSVCVLLTQLRCNRTNGKRFSQYKYMLCVLVTNYKSVTTKVFNRENSKWFSTKYRYNHLIYTLLLAVHKHSRTTYLIRLPLTLSHSFSFSFASFQFQHQHQP